MNRTIFWSGYGAKILVNRPVLLSKWDNTKAQLKRSFFMSKIRRQSSSFR